MDGTFNASAAIFGLRYLEEESVDIQDIIGCYAGANTQDHITHTACDDSDVGYGVDEEAV